MSIIKCRVLYVQYADDDRGKVPFYVKEILPADETLKRNRRWISRRRKTMT